MCPHRLKGDDTITGYFVRVPDDKTEGKWVNLDIAELSDRQILDFVDTIDHLTLAKNWLITVLMELRNATTGE